MSSPVPAHPLPPSARSLTRSLGLALTKSLGWALLRLAVVPAVLVGVVAACGQATPGGSPTPAGSGATDGGGAATASASDGGSAGASGATETVTVRDVTLTARPQPGSGSRLVVDYTLTHSGSADLVALDRVPADLGSATLPPDLDPEHAWVYVADGVARVSKQAFAIAPGVRFMAAPVTGGRALPPGGTLTGRASVPLPLTLDVPGDSFEAPRDPVGQDVRTWQLCIQVVERTSPVRPSPDDPETLLVPVTAPEPGRLLCTPPSALPLR
ncbi:hypothetical protein N865_21780 [Intrasporangium oryzae NRRL B-24470]|uniref:Uncharacterized protein n=1 Tax=Intrasporangium oryzae NRRL B-24470 TaxID=1386089 RepID=W9G4C4_9MICO|nr:hypothetical protein [Intrasporangium oryzae]EWS99637.1 hypothetical protein N865_21780 [Intrasporangium oryzae NRRL B-24470]